MTFAEYNTDENFENDKSSLEELVKIGKSEGMSKDSIRSALSPKWQKSSKLDKFDEYYGKETPKKEATAPKTFDINNTALNMSKNNVTPKPSAPVSNPPEKEKAEESTAPKDTEESKVETPKVKTDTLDKKSKEYMTKQDEIADTGLNTTINDIEGRREYNWEQNYNTMKNAGAAFGRINDKMIEQLPTFMFKRYANGEFGDPKSPDAKLRFAHFLLNGVQSKLKNASNAAMIAAGKSPMYQDTMSDYEKYQQSNFAKGMENRWRKYEAETENAIQLASKESMSEQDARLEAEKIANDKKMSTRWNMMDARQKVDLMTIKKEIGKLVGDMDLSEIADFMTGEAISGDLSKDEAVAIGVAQLIKKTPGLLAQLPEGKYKDMIIGMFGGGDVNSIIATLGTGIGDAIPGGSDTSSDYKQKLKGDITALGEKYYNGEISEEEFNKQYNDYANDAKQHGINNILSVGVQTPSYIIKDKNKQKQNAIKNEFKELNQRAKNGEIKPSDYTEQFNQLLETAPKYGVNEKTIASYEKGRVPIKTMLKAAEKKNKK